LEESSQISQAIKYPNLDQLTSKDTGLTREIHRATQQLQDVRQIKGTTIGKSNSIVLDVKIGEIVEQIHGIKIVEIQKDNDDDDSTTSLQESLTSPPKKVDPPKPIYLDDPSERILNETKRNQKQ
jgi:hypothetical protein